LAFVRLVAGHDQVWLVDADGSNPRPAFAGDAAFVAGRAPSWSPDGARLVFAFGEPGSPSSGLATVTVDGGGPELLAYDSRNCCENSAPAWSPDGRRVAFLFVDVSRPGNPSAVRVLDVTDGSIADVLGGSTSGPAWAPDGLEVLARSSTGLAAASPAGTSATRVVLTTNQLDTGAPSWR
jgi:Tol biopolymer transport system component